MADTSRKLEIIIEGDDRTKGAFTGIKSALSGLGGLATKGLAIGAAGAAAAVGLAAGLGLSVKEAMEAQQVQAQLEAVLKSTGGIAGVTAEQANKLATNLGNLTRFGDETVLSGENMLLTFTNIGKDVFPEATQTMLDMSQAMGQDVTASAMQLGKALNDPVQGVTALRRVGVQLTDAQEEQIKAMVESGDVMGAQKVILAELRKEFGGSAEAAGNTFAGQLDRLRNSFSNTAESVGNALLPSIQILADKLLKFVQSEKFQAWIQKVADWLANELPPAIQAASDFLTNTLIPAVVKFGQWMSTTVIPVLQKIWEWLATNLPPAIAALSAFWSGTLLPAIQAVAQFISTSVIPVLQKIWEWLATNLPPAIAALSAFWSGTLLPAIQAVAQFISTSVIPVLQAIWEWFSTTIPAALATLRAAWEGDFMGIRTIFEGVWNAIKTLFEIFRAAFEGDWTTFGQKLRELMEGIGKTMIEAAGSFLRTLVDLFKKAWEGIKNINWLELGKAVIQGLGNGIMAMGKWLIDKLIGVAQGAYDAAVGFFSSKSPSKLFEGLGKTLPMGLALGIVDQAKRPVMAVQKMAAALAPATMQAMPSRAMATTLAGRGASRGASLAPLQPIVINYSPMISTGSRAEFESQFVPLVDQAFRQMNRRRV